MNFRNTFILSTLGAVLALAACGNSDTPKNSADQPPALPQQGEPANTPARGGATEPGSSAALPTTPLDRDALFGLVSDTIIDTAPCPFLSDTTAVATADTDYELIRREVSNEECRWSKNEGFSVIVSVDPAATGTPLKDRAYNLDTPPVVKGQPGPGDAAVILYDTAWETERPFAMGFEQRDKLVTVFVTGLETDPARLTATAEEVAAKLPMAPTIDSQRREIKPALKFCDIWSDENIGSLMGVTPDDGLSSSAYGKAGCKWRGGYGASEKSMTLARYEQGDTSLDRMLEIGGKALSDLGDRSVILTRGPSDGYAGDTSIWVDVGDHQFNLTLSGTVPDHAAVAENLVRNLFSRI
ncbi:hypothetical protein [Hyphomonas sp.]|jgi:hypothetical protein|uniref:hypothetical protein n=1 Tax=Hyphomonas sp. TaxID=87 RepID=UPI0039E4F3F0